MATFGQMLAAAQAYSTPEQQKKIAASEALEKQYEVEKEKKSQQQELQSLIEKGLKESSKSRWGVLGKIGKAASFFNPTLAAAISTISDVGTAVDQKSALKKLIKDPKFAKYKNTWLGDPTKAFLKDVKGIAGDINPLMTGLTSLATSKLTSDIGGKISGKFKDAFTPSGGISAPGAEGVSQQLALPDITKSLGGGGGGVGFDFDLLKEGFTGGVKDFGFTGGATAAAPGLKGLFKDFDIMEMLEGIGDGTENLAALPALMQLFGIGGGGSSDYDASKYFQ